MSGAVDEEWVKAAMSDDAMVVDLLVRLHHTPPPLKPAAVPLEWTVRQRRSRPVSVTNNPKKPAHRASPTTPLSWSGATSVSGGSGGAGCVGSEESSKPVPFKLSNTTRSKINTDSEKAALKRSRKKKSLVELKDEENSLLKERRDLKREMVALRMNLERQRTKNENLKRMKIELRPRLDREMTTLPEESISGQLQQTFIDPIPPITPLISCNDVTLQYSTLNGADEASESKFILPDLNMPFDDDVICGVS
ncbi:hypothetical protein BUALT_Bualt07G0122000 [Buddleja alternifolia]|uniref:BZIP domain-containing protein n=1 Tax=Buddleja alternifolia TaxID=168488 RepID=A0AAV6X9I3_9LAMI|nr:hypothetical protein BUALT_Bualt07G0122000 [Buddleja alternifolia]